MSSVFNDIGRARSDRLIARIAVVGAFGMVSLIIATLFYRLGVDRLDPDFFNWTAISLSGGIVIVAVSMHNLGRMDARLEMAVEAEFRSSSERIETAEAAAP